MEQERNDPRFPEQPESAKIHGTSDDDNKKEKYIRDGGKIEDYPSQDEVAKMKSEPSPKNESADLTDVTGEEKKEDYINTDERKKDLEGRK